MGLYFEERGNKEAPTIVLIHGGGVAGWMWGKQVEYLKDYHCIIPDLPEHGKSIDERPLTIQDCTARIARLIEEKANGGKAHIVGHSLGGKIAVDLIAARPDLVQSAVVASALFRPMRMLKAMHKPYVYKMTVGMIRSKTILKMLIKKFQFPDSIYNENCMKDFQSLTADMLFREYDALYQNLKLPDGLEKANIPVLVLAGEKELNAMRESVKDIVRAIPGAKGAYVVKGDHTYPWSMYEGFNQIIHSWITEQNVSSSMVNVISGID